MTIYLETKNNSLSNAYLSDSDSLFRCLVGDPTGKSYGDVAFLEHHNLESNIECEMLTYYNLPITTVL